jgi:hypothetical protein
MNNRAGHYLARYFLAVVSIVCALAPAAAFATSYLPGQTLDPACTPTDPTCLVVANTAGTFIATSTTATSTFAGNVSVSGNVAIGSLSGILKAIAGVVQTALVNLATDVTGVLASPMAAQERRRHQRTAKCSSAMQAAATRFLQPPRSALPVEYRSPAPPDSLPTLVATTQRSARRACR